MCCGVILKVIPAVVSVLCKGHDCECGIRVQPIGINIHTDSFAVAEVGDANS